MIEGDENLPFPGERIPFGQSHRLHCKTNSCIRHEPFLAMTLLLPMENSCGGRLFLPAD
jgi:hypothetical protein